MQTETHFVSYLAQSFLEWARQALYCTYNVTMRRGRAIIITYSESVFVALGIQHAMRKRHIVFYGLSGSNIFYIMFSALCHKRHDFRKKKTYWTQNLCFPFPYKFCPKHFSF